MYYLIVLEVLKCKIKVQEDFITVNALSIFPGHLEHTFSRRDESCIFTKQTDTRAKRSYLIPSSLFMGLLILFLRKNAWCSITSYSPNFNVALVIKFQHEFRSGHKDSSHSMTTLHYSSLNVPMCMCYEYVHKLLLTFPHVNLSVVSLIERGNQFSFPTCSYYSLVDSICN